MWLAEYGARMPTVADAPRVLLVYADRVGTSMGGVGIRAVELARVLRDELGARVTIAAAETDGGDVGVPVVPFAPHSPRALAPLLADADAVIAQPGWPVLMRSLSRSGARLIFDLYDPEAFGTLEHFAGRHRRLRALMGAFAVDRLTDALRRGHHVMCASERQRDLWLGALLGCGLVTPARYDADPSLRSFLDVVSYGVPGIPPAAASEPPRTGLGIGADERLILWNGGIWSWLDAPTAIRAVGLLRERGAPVRLVFMGASSAAPAIRATEQARALAAELGLLGGGVIFHEDWVPYLERADWLLNADCAISTHVEHLETRFASRTRLLDCFWARLPVVCTAGDELAARVQREDLGAVVPPEDAVAVADALARVLDRGRTAYADRLAVAATDHAWSRVAAPLLRWLREPPPASPPRRPLDRRPSERLRSGAYLAAAALRLRPPRLSK
jgi:glycosyltransferase involved in cell wall biosynthesis